MMINMCSSLFHLFPLYSVSSLLPVHYSVWIYHNYLLGLILIPHCLSHCILLLLIQKLTALLFIWVSSLSFAISISRILFILSTSFPFAFVLIYHWKAFLHLHYLLLIIFWFVEILSYQLQKGFSPYVYIMLLAHLHQQLPMMIPIALDKPVQKQLANVLMVMMRFLSKVCCFLKVQPLGPDRRHCNLVSWIYDSFIQQVIWFLWRCFLLYIH